LVRREKETNRLTKKGGGRSKKRHSKKCLKHQWFIIKKELASNSWGKRVEKGELLGGFRPKLQKSAKLRKNPRRHQN